MKIVSILMLCLLMSLIAGCQDPTPVCPVRSGTPNSLTILPDELPTPTPGPALQVVRIGNQQVQVDKVVDGALCNDTWSGTVYVACDVRVFPWTEEPLFLKDCQLNIDPQAVVYVAYHNNTAYYNGCSCHTGATPQP